MARLSLSPHLPISGWKNRFMASLSHSSTVIIDGKAGSGKSTQIPQWAVEYSRREGNRGLVACTQSCRLSTVSLAIRVGEEMGEKVDFAIGQEQRGGSLKYCTDEWMMREMKMSPLLDEYSIVIIDQVNERSLTTDILIGLLKEILILRRDLRIVLMGSSIDCDKWVNYFGCYCPILSISSKSSLIIEYSPLTHKSLLDTAVDTVVFLHLTEKENRGGILLFLSTQEEVELARREIRRRVEGIESIPLHSDLPHDQLMRVHCPSNGRKCVVSTSIGETSIVFDGISFVIDGGFTSTSIYDPISRDESSQVISISKMTAKRRTERAEVRTIRLYSEDEFELMSEEEIPEIVRADPSRVEKIMDEMGMDGFDFFDRPAPTRWGIANY